MAIDVAVKAMSEKQACETWPQGGGSEGSFQAETLLSGLASSSIGEHYLPRLPMLPADQSTPQESLATGDTGGCRWTPPPSLSQKLIPFHSVVFNGLRSSALRMPAPIRHDRLELRVSLGHKSQRRSAKGWRFANLLLTPLVSTHLYPASLWYLARYAGGRKNVLQGLISADNCREANSNEQPNE
jgi:hypothetical protein